MLLKSSNNQSCISFEGIMTNSKKFAFIVIARLLRNMDFIQANRGINVLYVKGHLQVVLN